jgi:hypothetical protein
MYKVKRSFPCLVHLGIYANGVLAYLFLTLALDGELWEDPLTIWFFGGREKCVDPVGMTSYVADVHPLTGLFNGWAISLPHLYGT